MKKLNLKKILLGSISAFLFSSSYAQTLINKEWDKSTGNPSLTYDFTVSTLDANNRLIVVGNSVMGSQKENFLITKYDKDGSTLWQSNFDKAGMEDFATAVATYGNETYVTGVANEVGNGDFNYLTMKLDANGGIVWVKTYNGTGNATDAPTAIKLDASGNVYVTGGSTGNGTLMDFCTIKYDNNGNEIWVSRYDFNGNYDGAIGLDVDPNGTSVVTGASGTSYQNWDFLTMKFDANGSIIATERTVTAGNSFDKPVDIKRDDQGNIYIAGSTQTNGNDINIKLIKISSNFQLQWQKTFDGAGLKDEPSEIDIDGSGNIYLTGYTEKTNGGKDFITQKYTPSGIKLWEKRRKAEQEEKEAKAKSIDVDINGNVYVLGTEEDEYSKKYRLIRYDSNGNEIWTDEFKRKLESENEAKNIHVDVDGNVYVDGKSKTSIDEKYVSIKYNQEKTYIPFDNELSSKQWAFYPNKGQIINTNSIQDDNIMYYTNTANPKMFVSTDKISYVYSRYDSLSNQDSTQRIDLVFLSNNTAKLITSESKYYEDEKEKSCYLNYYLGGRPEYYEGITSAQRIVGKDLYSNIDLQLYSNAKGFKYYFTILPDGNPNDIKFKYIGATNTTLLNNQISIKNNWTTLQQNIFVAEQFDVNNNPIPISISCNNLGNSTYSFSLGSYDNTQPLFIKVAQTPPASAQSIANLQWSTYFGGSAADDARDIDINKDNEQFLTGNTKSTDFPVTTGLTANVNGKSGTFVSKFDENNLLKWCSYYGGNLSANIADEQSTNGIAVSEFDDACNTGAFVVAVGNTTYSDLPLPGSGNFHNTTLASTTEPDMFFAKFSNATGSLMYASLIGSSERDEALAVEIDNKYQDIIIAGTTQGNNFPLSNFGNSGNFYDGNGKGILIFLDCSNTAKCITGFGSQNITAPSADHAISTYIKDLVIDNNRNIIITGGSPYALPTSSPYNITNPTGSFSQSRATTSALDDNGFVAKFTPLTSNDRLYSLYYLTELGGSNINAGRAVTYNDNNDFYVTGVGSCNGFPIIPNGSNCTNQSRQYIARFSASGSLVYSNFLESIGAQFTPWDIACRDNYIYVFSNKSNTSNNYNLIQKTGAYFDNLNVGQKCLITELNPNNQVTWSTLFGGKGPRHSAGGNAFDKSGNMYICGSTESDQSSTNSLENYPLSDNLLGGYYSPIYSGGKDGFIAKLDVANITGLEQISKSTNSDFKIYPIPANNLLYIVLSQFSSKSSHIEVFNVVGKKLFDAIENNTKVNITIPLNDMQNGIYVIKVSNETYQGSLKFIVNK